MLDLDSRQTLIIAILVLFIGKKLNKEISFLREYNIPEPVTGGVLASVVFGAYYFITHQEVIFSLGDRDLLLIVFFTCIGLSAKIRNLVEGGKALGILLVCAVAYLFVQNFTGIAVSKIMGLDSVIGLIGGSVSLSGGHGTTIAWSETFIRDYGITNASEIGIACATFGLIFGGIIGGPIAKFLIKRYKLQPSSQEEPSVGIKHETISLNVDYFGILNSFLVIAIAMGLGISIDALVSSLGIKLPMFVSCLFAGIILTNTIPYIFKNIRWPTNTPSLALISDLSLGLFLAMSLMSLQLWTLAGLGGPILIILGFQVLVIVLFVIFIVFRVMGKDYDAAVMSAGIRRVGIGSNTDCNCKYDSSYKKIRCLTKSISCSTSYWRFFR